MIARGRAVMWRGLGVAVALCGTLAGCAAAPPAPKAPSAALLSARLRRLSNVEYERSANALLGLNEPIRDALPPDERQDGYVINERQAVPSYYAGELAREAERLSERSVGLHLSRFIPCPATDGVRSACVRGALDQLALQAFRRPPTASERAGLQALFERGARESPAPDGVAADPRAQGARLVLSTLLASPSMLYLSELGATPLSGDVTQLTPYEIASSIAYAVTGGPPDEELLAAAAAPSRLAEPAFREAEARRLLSLSSTRAQFREFVLEWLEIDQLARTAKATALVPDYDEVKSHMLDETRAFVDEVMVYGGASLAALLAAGFSSPDHALAAYYGIPGFAGPRVSLTRQGRIGVLEQASFLSAHAYEDVTSPVKRGDFVLRRVLCVDLPRPGEVGVEIRMPPHDDSLTTRARFAAHTSVASCRSCHEIIDPVGFSFENFDAAGRHRTREHDQPVTTAGEVTLAGRTLRFRDNAELVTELAALPESRSCFAKQALRYLTGRRSPAAEQWFGQVVDALPPDRRDSLLEWVVAWIRSPEFILRRRAS